VLPGAYLFITPWVLGTSRDEASSANAWIVGACIVVATLRVPIVSGPRVAERIKFGLGAWLRASPLVLGFAGSAAGWNTWIVGALILAPADTLILAFDFLGWIHAQRLRYQARRISPEKLLRCSGCEKHVPPERLCRHTVECSYEIRRTLLGQTSGTEVGLCILGYRACLNDGVTLNRLIDKELPEPHPLRRLRLKIARRQVAHSLLRAREVLPPRSPQARHRSRP
jgi:hypothetical protein